jgi:hypothetical protein
VAITVPFVIVVGGWLFRLGSPLAWARHWKLVAALIFAGEIVGVVAEPAWRCGVSLLRVCRKERFREVSSVVVVTCLAAGLWGLGFWYDGYRKSPHFRLELNDFFVWQTNIPVGGRFGIAHLREAPQPNTEIIFYSVRLNNSGVPSPANNWRVIVTSLSGDTVTGSPEMHGSAITDPQNPSRDVYTYTLQETIFYKAEKPITRTQPVVGAAAFIIVGMNESIAGQPGTELTLECDDKNGKTYSVTETVPPIAIAYPAERR